ncbi:MAG: FAD-dependent oxidoreductase, partial [Anaerolineae bacterium]|nr:FAD-dependent oxidoreductase [Anaerolineae bacterium]
SMSSRDTHLLRLIERLGLQDELRYHAAHLGFVHNGAVVPMRTIRDFLAFSPLHLRDRLRLGQTVAQALWRTDWHELDQIPVRDWLIRVGGLHNFERIWAPLLEAKFDYEYADVPATFVWQWLNRATGLRGGLHLKPAVVNLRQGPGMLMDAMAKAVLARSGNEIRTQTRVREIEVFDGHMGRVRTHTGIFNFDAVIGAIPTPVFSRLLLNADEAYLNSLGTVRYLGLVCPALVLDKPLSNYWNLSLTDPSSPFSSIIEMAYPDDPRYHIVYLPKYTAPENDWLGVPDEAIRDAWLMRLRQIFPTLKPESIKHFLVSRSRYVDPVHTLGAADRIQPVQTPYDGLYLANASQVYPDLPTSEAIVAHAQRVAQMVAQQGERPLVAETAA